MFQHCCSLGAIPQPLGAGKKQTTSENQGWAGERAARTAPCFSCHPPRDVPSWDTAPSAAWGVQQVPPSPITPCHGPPRPSSTPGCAWSCQEHPSPISSPGREEEVGRRKAPTSAAPSLCCRAPSVLDPAATPPIPQPPPPWQCSQCSQSRPAWAERSPGRGRQPSPPLPPAKGQGTAEPFPCPKRALGCSRSPQAPTKPQSPKQQKENSPSLPSRGQRGLGFLQQGEAGEPGTA